MPAITEPSTDTLLRAADLADAVGVRLSNVQSWIRRGELKAASWGPSGRGPGHTVGLYSLARGQHLARLLFERKQRAKA